MGANYNCKLIAAMDQDAATAIVGGALQRLGFRIVHRETPDDCRDGFGYPSNRAVFIGPPSGDKWIQLVETGERWGDPFPSNFVSNPLSVAISIVVHPVVDLWSYDSGNLAGYGIYERGHQVEAQTLAWKPEVPLDDFAPVIGPPQPPTLLGKLLREPGFDYEGMARGFEWY